MGRLRSELRARFPAAYREARDLYHWTRLTLGPRGRRLRDELEPLRAPCEVHAFACKHLPPYQVRSEILALIEFLATRSPRTYVEIGIANGGTHFLVRKLCPAIATSVAIDLEIHNRHLLDLLTGTRSAHYIEASSHDERTRRRLERILDGQPIEALFIDGDHSYEGVRRDFELYRGYVRPGGAIVLHDIVPDHGQRFGRPTRSHTGGVPRFFAEIKDRFEHLEFVEDPDQDGFGIGVVIT